VRQIGRKAGQRLRGRLDPCLLLVLFLSLFPIAPLLQQGYMWDAHDARHDVYFIFELDRGIQDGILYPRWQPDFAFGYGYPFFNIYGPLPTYVGEAFHLLGFGFAGAVKMVFLLSIAASGLAMYGFARSVLGRRAGLVAAVAYMVIPYRLVDVYVRAALAETVAYVFVPLILWAVWAALRRPRLSTVLALAVAYAALIFTHPLTALLLSVVLVFFVAALALARANERQPFRQMSRGSVLPFIGHLGHLLLPVAAGLALGIGLSAFFLVPAMVENRFVRVDQWYGGRYAWGGDFVEFFQLFSPVWGYGTSEPGPGDTMSLQLGAVPLVLALFAVLGLGRREGRNPHPASPVATGEGQGRRGGASGARTASPDAPGKAKRGRQGRGLVIAFFAALAVVAVYLTLGVSAPVWQVLPLARLVQFPWRMLALAALAISFLSGAVVPRARSEKWTPGFGATALVILLILGSLPYMQAKMSQRDVSMAGLMQFQQSADEMTGSTAWVKTIPTWSSMADYHISGKPVTSKINYKLLYQQEGVQARTLELRSNLELIEYLAPDGALITFDTFYYPGWRAYLVDNDSGTTVRELLISTRGDLGLMTVEVPAGIGRVLLRFEDSPLRRASKIASWVVVALCLILLAVRWLARRRRAGAEPAAAECAEEACRRVRRPPHDAEREGR